ncbi:hypothetical protein QQ045_032349 [Rhodiola kirilowii]
MGEDRGIHWIKADNLYKEKINGGMGFWRFELMNKALLAKQGWMILTRPELLVCKILKAKYFPESDILNSSLGYRPSFAWRGIFEGLEIVKLGVEWDDSDNKYVWTKDGSVALTVKGAYWCAVDVERLKSPAQGEQLDIREVQKFWRSLWKLRIPNRIKLFTWRLYHDSLPTMYDLAKRGCSVEDKCSHCGLRSEKALHVFKDCWWMRCLLQELHLPEDIWNNQCDSTGYWLWLCAKLCSEEQFTSLICGLWCGWKDRNEMVHGKEGRCIEELKIRLSLMLKEFKGSMTDFREQRPRPRLSVKDYHGEDSVIWCDASFDPSLMLGGMGAAFMSNGNVMEVLASWSEWVEAVLEAECKAIKLGMVLAQRKGLTKAKFLTDSREALWALNIGCWRPGARLGDINHCIKGAGRPSELDYRKYHENGQCSCGMADQKSTQ